VSQGEHPILIKFTSFLKLPTLIYERNLASSNVRVGKDLSIEARRIRTKLVLYLKDAKKGGHKTFLRKMF
jgi:hypothetical protein